MNSDTVAAVVREALGVEPLAVERQPMGHTSAVYAVRLPDCEIIARLSTNPFVFKGTARNIEILRGLGLPVPHVLAADLSLARHPFHFMLLEKVPGCDLGLAIRHMTPAQMTTAAEAVVGFQRAVGGLPAGVGYGWEPIGDPGRFAVWTDLVAENVQKYLPELSDVLSAEESTVFVREMERRTAYLASVSPICFLDDLTTKNVIVDGGRVRGIVDLDCVCYGDPLYWIALTQAAIVSDPALGRGHFYVEEICRLWTRDGGERALVDFYTAVHLLHFLDRFRRFDETAFTDQALAFIRRWAAVAGR